MIRSLFRRLAPYETLLFSESPVHQLNARRTFAHCRGDAFHASGTNVPYRKDARYGCLEHIGLSRQRPAVGCEILPVEVGARSNEAFVIQSEAAGEPGGVGNRAGHEEEMMDWPRLAPAVGGAVPGDMLQALVALQSGDLRS